MTRTLLGGLAALALLATATQATAAAVDACLSPAARADHQAREVACAKLIAAGGDIPTMTRAHVARGYSLSVLGRDDEALKAAEAALVLSPDDLNAQMLRVEELDFLGRTDEAFAVATEAIKAHPDKADGWVKRGTLWQYDRKELKPALADYEAAIKADPKAAFPYYYRAGLAPSSAAALLDLDTAVALWPGSAMIHTARGDALAGLGRTRDAIAAYDAALRLNPHDGNALIGRAYDRLKLNDIKGATQDAEAAVAHEATASALFVRGYVREEAKAWDLAAADYEAAVATAPDRFSYRLGLARVRRAQGRYDEALAALTAADRIEPESADVPAERAQIWVDRGDFAKAVVQYDIAIARSPAAQTYYDRGLAHSALRNHRAALADYGKAAELDPTSPDALTSRGVEEGELGMLDAQAKSLAQALALDPGNLNALSARADAQIAKDDMAGAAQTYEEALKSHPDEPNLWFCLSEIRHDLGDPAEALKAADRGLKLDSKSQLGLKDRATALEGLGRPAEVIRVTTTAVALYPKDQEFLYLRAGALVSQGDLAGARRDLDLYLQLSPKASGALTRRGEVHRAEGHYDLARADFDQALAVEPDAVRTLYDRGLLSMDEERYDRAIKDFNLALTLTPGDPDILAEKGETYRRMDDHLSAVETLDLAIKANPKLAFAWQVRSLAKQDLGDTAGAAADMAQAKRLDPTIK